MSTSQRRWFAPVLLVLGLLATPAQADLVPYLDIIGWDELEADDRFVALTRSGGLRQGLAVFDTGIDPDHDMFAGAGGATRVVVGENFAGSPFAAIATPGTLWADGNMHGTFVSSLAAGNSFTTGPLTSDLVLDGQTFTTGTEVEFGGVARGADLVAVRVLGNDGVGWDDDILDALNWVIDNHETYDIRVLNLSLGGGGPYADEDEVTGPDIPELIDAVATLRSLDIPVVIASGNDGFIDGLSFPAIIENAISVGASIRDENDLTEELIADFSNFNDQLDLIAPGVDNVGAMPRGFAGDVTDAWDHGNGTSYAAPQVAGAVLLINEVFEDYWGRRPTYDETFAYLTHTDVTITDDDSGLTFPRLNLTMALEHAITQGGTETPNVVVWTGNGDETWDSAGNWVGSAPSAGQELMFTGVDTDSAQNTMTAGTNFAGIIFATSAEAFTLTGNAIEIDDGGEIRIQSPLTQTLDLDIETAGDLTLVANGGLLQINGDMQLATASTLETTGEYHVRIDGAIAGNAELVQNSEGSLTLRGASTYTGGTDIQQGLLITANDALPDAGAVTLTGGEDAALALGGDETIGALAGNDGSAVALDTFTLTVGNASNTTFAGSFTGNGGALTKQGSGELRLTGVSDHTGATTVLAGRLVVADEDSNLSNAMQLRVASGATFELDDGDETVGSLTNVSGAGGTVQINDNHFALSGTADSLFNGTITGAGGLSVAGSDAIDHDLSGATIQYTGVTRVFGGRLLLPNGDVPGDLENYATFTTDGTVSGDVLNAGRFGGNATIDGRFTNHSGGTVAAGHSIGTITVNGDYEALAGSELEVEVEGAGFEGGTYTDTQADLLRVNAAGGDDGDATFRTGSIIRFLRLDGGMPVEHENVFLIVNADGGVTLEDGVQINGWSRFTRFMIDPSFASGDNLLLVQALTRNIFSAFARDADENVRQIADGLDSLAQIDEEDPLIAAILDRLDEVAMNEEQDVFISLAPSVGPQAYDMSLPVILENATTANNALARHHTAKRLGMPSLAMSQSRPGPFLETALASAADSPWMFRESIDRREPASQPARRDRWRRVDEETERDWSLFAYALRGSQDQDTTSSRLGYNADAYGFLTGFDYHVVGDLHAGLTIGYMRTEVDLNAGRGDHEIGTLRVGPQVSYSPMPWFVDGAVTYGYHRFDSERRMPSLNLSAESKHTGHDLSAFARTGYQFQFNRFHLTPTASVEYLYLSEEGYTEKGGGAMIIDSRSEDSLRSRLALTLDYRFEADNAVFIPEVAAGWEREHLSTDGSARARFVAGGDAFTTNIAERETDVWFYSAGLGLLIDERMTGYVRYEGRRHSDGDAYGLTIGGTVRF